MASVFDVLTEAVLAVVFIGATAIMGGILVTKFASQDETNSTAIANLKDTVLSYLDDPLTYLGILILVVIFGVIIASIRGMQGGFVVNQR